MAFYLLSSLVVPMQQIPLPEQPPFQHNVGRGSLHTLPQETIDTRFRDVAKAVAERWNQLVGHLWFPSYRSCLLEQEIFDEFEQYTSFRFRLHVDVTTVPYQSNPLFQLAQELYAKNRFRQPNCISFEHSLTDTSYNSTCIQVGKRRFLALEGPQEEHVPYFFRLLLNWKVASLVCLTDVMEKGVSKCHPYWIDRVADGNIGIPMENQREMPMELWKSKKIPFFAWPAWPDRQGVDPDELIQAVNLVRGGVKEEDLIAVHCSAGVGRTGTFISAVALLDAIDEQLSSGKSVAEIELSIPKLFIYLNLHRPWMVSQPSQYATLYRVVDRYLERAEKTPLQT